MTGEIAVRVIITGRVQGVWFRGWTVQEALARRLNGWVRNCPDGTVEVVLAGPAEKVLNAQIFDKVFAHRYTVTGTWDEPIVEKVIVEGIESYRVYVIGRVGSPGAISAEEPLRVLQALAIAGGFDEFASENECTLL